MTEKKQQRTRRRFLADLLFVGGGVTAASLVAKNALWDSNPGPVAAGEMAMPQELAATPCPLPTPETPPMPGAPVPIETKGDFSAPQPDQPTVKGGYSPPVRPPTAGKPVAPPPPKDGSKP